MFSFRQMSYGCLLALFLPCVWAQQSADQAQAARQKGAVLFSQNCAACHGSDGRGGERAPSIATRHDIVSLSDADLRLRIDKGVLSAGMPAFGFLGQESVDNLVAYLRQLQGRSAGATAALPGNPATGETLFFHKGNCASCHMMQGHGGFMAEDLSGYGEGRSPDSIRSAITNPDGLPGTPGQATTITTAAGQSFTGLVRAEDNFSVTLQTEDGAFHSLSRATIAKLEPSGHSLMPGDYGTRLSAKELDDLVSYLMTAHPSAERADASRPDKKD